MILRVLSSKPVPRGAFSLVEVTLALGIVAFAVVGILGVLPQALSTGRQSFDESRAAAIANTVFASFRGQGFARECYLDSQYDPATGQPLSTPSTPPLNFTTLIQKPTDTFSVSFYGKYIDPVAGTDISGDPVGDQRRLCFLDATQALISDYSIGLNLSWPSGAVYVTTGPTMAVQVELIVASISHPQNSYRFVSTVANRAN